MTQDTKTPISAAPPDPAPDLLLEQQIMLLVDQLVRAHIRAHHAALPDPRSGLHIQTNRRIEQGRAQAFKSALQLVLHFLQPYITPQHKEHIHANQLSTGLIQRPSQDHPQPYPETAPPTPAATNH